MAKYVLGAVGLAVVGVLGYLFVWVPLQHTTLDEALPIEESTAQEEVVARATVVPTTLHPASGYVRIVEEGGKRYVRFEEFQTINGPDLFVYLASDTGASDFIDLGSLKATQGSFNYEIPAGVDLAHYSHVLVWCRAFSVLFNSADLAPIL